MLDYYEPLLVEASFARVIKDSYGCRTIIDEPFAFKAAINFFEKDDTDLLTLLSSAFFDNLAPSAQGYYLETFSPAVLIPIFHGKVLSRRLFSSKKCYPKILEGHKAVIVGWDKCLRGVHHHNMSLMQFMDAHYYDTTIRFTSWSKSPHFSSRRPIVQVQMSCSFFVSQATCTLFSSLPAAKAALAFETVSYEAVDAHLSSTVPLSTSNSSSDLNPVSSLDGYCTDGKAFFSLPFCPAGCANPPLMEPERVGQGITQYKLIINKDNTNDLFSGPD
ncbi:hypothetical protein KVV02_001176 [Mortierella alpina]|uniref:Uncharacterized protein n=1 Tax=Mortierella alpina TaxID=64518 RepID=A0A9P8CV46_MORAP|nr:hypothetical protein KVV02_001176 [Mortierella alpina]